ncbi:MAG: chemotaxis response regulator protein-glutamate methylesterase [Candidatus Omnitrophota bacterium]
MNKKIRVLIADDSALLRKMLRDCLEKSGHIEVIGFAENGKEAVRLTKEMSPDIVILDCVMPVMTGLEALQMIMRTHPVPVFIFSSYTSQGSELAVKALEYGAVDIFLRPAEGNSFDMVSHEMVTKIILMAFSRKSLKTEPLRPARLPAENVTPRIEPRLIDLVAMGSSTGGVQAATYVIPLLPETMKPIVWVQHMPRHFTKAFAERLNTLSKMTVKEAVDKEVIRSGTCYLAPGGIQMRIGKSADQYQIRLGETDKVSGHCPSCDVLFETVAEYAGSKALGVILTGMGEDGTRGLVRMHERGAFVIGQDEESCVVYGMPKAAYKSGAVDVEMDIHKIAAGIQRVAL